MPRVDEHWLDGFSRGLLALADEHGCELVGGDTTRGPLTICVTVFGEVPQGEALLRSGAAAGEDIYASGTLGDARLALEVFRGTLALAADVFGRARARMEQPTPRIALGQALRRIATSAIDVSDGLLGDLGHILRQSAVGASIDAAAAQGLMAAAGHLRQEQGLDYVLAGGDDYELVFTAPPARREAVQAAASQARTTVTRIGRVEAEPGIRVLDSQGRAIEGRWSSFDHFA
jgi:thiamine-monophosphate kinase